METKIEMAIVPEFKLVSDPAIARKLLKDGYRIADIKAKKGHERESVFIFKVENGFMEKMGEYIADRKESKAARQEKTEE